MFQATKWVLLVVVSVLAFCSFKYPAFDPKDYDGPAVCVAELLNPATDGGRLPPWLKRASGYALAAVGLLSAAYALTFGVTDLNKIAINVLVLIACVLVFLTVRRARTPALPPIDNRNGLAK